MKAIADRAKKTILAYLLKRYPTGDSIPRSGEEAERVDCFTIFVAFSGEQESWFLEQLDGTNLRLRRRVGVGAAERVEHREVALSDVDHKQFEVKHYKGYFDFTYPSLAEWVWRSLVLYELWAWVGHFATIQLYKRFSSSTKLRIDVLKALVDHDLNSRGVMMREGVDIMEAMRLIYGKAFWYVEGVGAQMRRLTITLDSLVTDGALSKRGDNYSITPKALAELERYEMERLRFEASVAQSRRLNRLTAALILVGLFQIESIRNGAVYLAMWVWHWIHGL